MFYECDPNKAITCRKRDCFLNGGECGITSNVKYAKDPNKPLGVGNACRVTYKKQKLGKN